MLEFKNRVEYNQYVAKLSQAIEHDSWKEFMDNNKYMDVYFSSTYEPDTKDLSSPYFAEIDINSVVSCNVSSARKEIPSNWERVVGAVRYIITEQCIPIAVIKLDDGKYYIENGKHRFYAHVLLGKETIPVSVREIEKGNTLKGTMLSYNIPFFNNDSMVIAYPEKVEDFFNQYINIENRITLILKKVAEIGGVIENIEESINLDEDENFRKQLSQVDDLRFDIKRAASELDENFSKIKLTATSAEIKRLDDNRYILHIEMTHDRNIIINGSCSAGNETRSSKCTCNILNKLGYSVDMKYVSNHTEFKLEDKRDAHNMNFDMDININDVLENIILNIDKKEKYFDSEKYNSDFQMLIKYVSNYKKFNASVLFADYCDSSIIPISETYYYVLVDDSQKNAYVFKSNAVPFDNLNIQFLGRLDSNNELYKKLI